ncbi:MAG: hypothetical protein OEU76_08570, partial [Cyclobacteriaceae bacterium]|nr:hypothetical protein [Cyclobacteriaceae bacterium]
LRDKDKYKSGTRTWELILLDTVLHEIQNLELEVDHRKSLVGYEQTKGFLFLIFKSSEILKLSLDLVAIQLNNVEISKYEINPELQLQLTHFSKVSDNFIFGGYVNNEPAILIYSPLTNNIKVLPGFFQKQTELVELRQNQNQTFNIVLLDRGDRTQKKMIFKTFDGNGIELFSDEIPIEEKYVLQTGLSSMLIREDLAVIGTWGTRGSKQSLGFFAVPINPFSNQEIKYTAFGELSHYLDDQSPKRAKKIKEKTKEATKVNRMPDYSNYVMPYRIEELPQGFILLAESYTSSSPANIYSDPGNFGYPTYPSPYYGYYPYSYNRMYNPYYRTDPNNIRDNDNIRVSQSVAIAFNEDGDVLWDYSIDLDSYRSHSIEQVADFCVYREGLFFLYKKESELIVKTITLDSDETADSVEKIKLVEENDEIRGENKSIGGTRHWYGKTFYVWGQHTIRNKYSSEESSSRQVFYINKVVPD